MRIIRFFCDFEDPLKVPGFFEKVHRLCETAETVEEGEEAYGKTYKFTNGDDYTHAVILNNAMPDLKVPKERVIGLAFEPPAYLGLTPKFIEYARNNIGTYYIGDVKGLPPPFKEGYGYMWHMTPPLKSEIPDKTKWMSIIFSRKLHAPGHRYRHALVQKILETDLPIDIYGRGCVYYKNYKDHRLKGEFTEREPYMDYKYHIAIENFPTPHYFSEKIINPLLCNTKTIYIGCTNIKEYFEENIIQLTGNITDDINILKKVYETDQSDNKNDINQEEIISKVTFTKCVKEYLID